MVGIPRVLSARGRPPRRRCKEDPRGGRGGCRPFSAPPVLSQLLAVSVSWWTARGSNSRPPDCEPGNVFEVEGRRQQFAGLVAVDEIWIMDTASFEVNDRYVSFTRTDGGTGRNVEKFVFYDGTLFASYKNGMPVLSALPGAANTNAPRHTGEATATA